MRSTRTSVGSTLCDISCMSKAPSKSAGTWVNQLQRHLHMACIWNEAIKGCSRGARTLRDRLSNTHKSLNSCMSVFVQLMRHCLYALVYDPVAVLSTAGSWQRGGAEALQAESFCPMFLLLLQPLHVAGPNSCMGEATGCLWYQL